MKKGSRDGFWQSFADLAMGTMAVIILILLLVLSKQTQDDEQYRKDLRAALEAGRAIVAQQERLARLIAEVFTESSCPLRFDPVSGRLEGGAGGGSANLYPEGSVALSDAGRDALDACGLNFLTLVVCFEERAEAAESCHSLLERLDPDDAERRWGEFQSLRGQIEAMVLEGNTDRVRTPGTPPIRGVRRRDFPDGATLQRHEEFVSNAHLGAERARQALGKLAQVVAAEAARQGLEAVELDAQDALFGLISLESAAFGRYMAGPLERRRPGCDDGEASCDEARNLSLRLRWSEGSLRKPFDAIIQFYCARLAKASKTYETETGDRVLCGDRGATP